MFAACLLPFLVLAWRSWGFLPPLEHGDYAHYLLHAKALATGKRYDDTGYIYTTFSPLIGPRNQLPGWPLILAPFVAVFGEHSSVFRLLEILATCVFVVTAGRYFARREGLLIGGAIVLMVPVALETQYATYSPMSDLPFCVCLWALVALADREGAWTWGRGIACMAIALVALSIRAAGVALFPALVLFGLTRPATDRRFMLRPALLVAAVGFVVALVRPDVVPFGDQLLKNVGIILYRPIAGWRIFSDSALNGLLYPFPWDQANDLYHGVLILPIAIGTVGFLVQYRRTFVWWIAIVYGLMLAFSPVQTGRYLWPLYPLLAFVACSGVREIAHRFAAARPSLAPQVAFGVIALASVLSAGRLLERPAPRSLLGDPDVQSLFAWLQQTNRLTPLRVVFMNPRVLTLETGIPAMGSLPARDRRALRELQIRHVTHVITGDAGGWLPVDRRFARFVLQRPNVFTTAYENGSFHVYKVEPDALTRASTDSTASR